MSIFHHLQPLLLSRDLQTTKTQLSNSSSPFSFHLSPPLLHLLQLATMMKMPRLLSRQRSCKEPCHLPPKGYVRPCKLGLPREVNLCPRPNQSVKRPGEHHRVIEQRNDVSPNNNTVRCAGIVVLNAPPQHTTQDDPCHRCHCQGMQQRQRT